MKIAQPLKPEVLPGFKFKFMRDAYMKAMDAEELLWAAVWSFRDAFLKLCEESWEVKYEYVWGLDSDLDLTGGTAGLDRF